MARFTLTISRTSLQALLYNAVRPGSVAFGKALADFAAPPPGQPGSVKVGGGVGGVHVGGGAGVCKWGCWRMQVGLWAWLIRFWCGKGPDGIGRSKGDPFDVVRSVCGAWDWRGITRCLRAGRLFGNGCLRYSRAVLARGVLSDLLTVALPQLTFQDGSTTTCDVLVAADGIRSKLGT